MPPSKTPLTPRQVELYLERIGLMAAPPVSLGGLEQLQLAHLSTVPFENLAVYAGRSVATDDGWTYNKIVANRRGGWCFEVNGAFAQLLDALGFRVQRLAAAVLLGGPNVVVDHLALEVMLDEPYLVEVGFGDNAPVTPLPLQHAGPIETTAGTFELLASPQGTTLAQVVDDVPEARYRFKRVHHSPSDFTPASDRLQTDRTLHWSTSPFATRLLKPDGSRMTLTRNALKVRHGASTTQTAVDADDWNDVLYENFGIVESFTRAQLTKA